MTEQTLPQEVAHKIGAVLRPVVDYTARLFLTLKDMASDLFAEYAPQLRSTTILNGYVVKFISLVGWTVPAATQNKLVSVIAIAVSCLAFAGMVHGRMRARGPIITPRDEAQDGMGPGAAAGVDQTFSGQAAPRTF